MSTPPIPPSSPLSFTSQPTASTLSAARTHLDGLQEQLSAVRQRISEAEAQLAQIVADSQCNIKCMTEQERELQEEANRYQAYLSPIRRLPAELLREVFHWGFVAYPCCAWVFASVCKSWRKLALSTPKIWSKIRLVTRQNASADTIRLWLERSGNTLPLDIEIFLRINKTVPDSPSRPARSPSPTGWTFGPYPHPGGASTHYLITHPGTHSLHGGITILPPSHTPVIVPPSPSQHHWAAQAAALDANESVGETPTAKPVKSGDHWGHIAFFYLVEQMHRWERFVFRHDRNFASIGALRSISGDAPLLKEFEVSCAENIVFPQDWSWLPSAALNTTVAIPQLKAVTLQYTSFKYTSPMLRNDLTNLTLRALPTRHLALDRILSIISNNPNLENLSLHFCGVSSAILPLSQVTLQELKCLTIGGHYTMTQIVECLTVPNLTRLTLDLDAREPIEDVVTNLLTRSKKPLLEHLSIAYGSSGGMFLYGPVSMSISWGLLSDLGSLKSLHIGGTPLDPLLIALGIPDDDPSPPAPPPGAFANQPQADWLCPELTELCIRSCPSHGSEGTSKLVQMIDARNPAPGVAAVPGNNGVKPVRLKSLELHESATLGADVVTWLKQRVEHVDCTDPTYSDR